MSNKKLIFFLIIAMVIWGGSWTSAKLISVSAPTESVIFWRFLFTTISMLPLVSIFKVSLKVSLKEISLLALGGFVMFLYNIGFLFGVKNGFAGAGGVLVTGLNPVFTFLLTILLLREKTSSKQLIILALGLAGGLVMLEIWSLSSSQILDGGNIFFLMASTSWAFMTILSQKIQKRLHFITYSLYVYFFCTIYGFIFSLANNAMFPIPSELPYWLNILYLSLGATSIATTIYFLCTKQLGSRLASSFIFTVPVSAVFFSFLLLGEVPQLHTVIGGLLTITAVYLINLQKN